MPGNKKILYVYSPETKVQAEIIRTFIERECNITFPHEANSRSDAISLLKSGIKDGNKSSAYDGVLIYGSNLPENNESQASEQAVLSLIGEVKAKGLHFIVITDSQSAKKMEMGQPVPKVLETNLLPKYYMDAARDAFY